MNFLNNKSTVDITYSKHDNGIYSFDIDTVFSDRNQCGSCGDNNYIRRHDAVHMVQAMNLKMNTVVKEYFKSRNMEVPDELKNTDEILSYVLWGLREIDGIYINDINSEHGDMVVR